jgi:hypothetical protein
MVSLLSRSLAAARGPVLAVLLTSCGTPAPTLPVEADAVGGNGATAGSGGASATAGGGPGTGGTGTGGSGTGGVAAGAGGDGAGSAGSGAMSSCGTAPSLGKPRVWRLTRAQITNTLRDSFGFVPPSLGSIPVEARLDGFANQAARLTISSLLAETLLNVGGELGTHAAANPASFGIGCSVAELSEGPCLSAFIASAGEKMWRRPLSAPELASLTTLFNVTVPQGGPATAVASVVQALFLSPNFLHRTELGTTTEPGTVSPLTHYELASALSYLIWDSGPDAELMTLAREAKLRDRTLLLAQARRMFELRDKSEPAMNDFLAQWLYLETLSSTTKNTSDFPMATPEVAQDLNQELRLFVNSVLFDPRGDRNLRTLLTATYSFVNERTAPLYGIAGVSGPAMVRRDLDPAQRRGIASMLPFLWGHSHSEDTNLVGRGAYFRGEFLCDRVPLPEGGVPAGNFAPPNSTGRQRLTIHATAACAGCHALFDGIGFALENYDAVGQYRTTEYGQTIDPSGSLPLPSQGDEPIDFVNFVDMVDQLAEKPDIYGCFAQQFAAYASGRDIPELDPCEKSALVERFSGANHKIDELVMSVIGSSSFMDRKN